MLVWDKMNKGPNGCHNMQVVPAAMDRSAINAEWFDETPDGPRPKTIVITFKNGCATVDNALGNFLVAHNLVTKHRPLIRV